MTTRIFGSQTTPVIIDLTSETDSDSGDSGRMVSHKRSRTACTWTGPSKIELKSIVQVKDTEDVSTQTDKTTSSSTVVKCPICLVENEEVSTFNFSMGLPRFNFCS